MMRSLMEQAGCEPPRSGRRPGSAPRPRPARAGGSAHVPLSGAAGSRGPVTTAAEGSLAATTGVTVGPDGSGHPFRRGPNVVVTWCLQSFSTVLQAVFQLLLGCPFKPGECGSKNAGGGPNTANARAAQGPPRGRRAGTCRGGHGAGGVRARQSHLVAPQADFLSSRPLSGWLFSGGPAAACVVRAGS